MLLVRIAACLLTLACPVHAQDFVPCERLDGITVRQAPAPASTAMEFQDGTVVATLFRSQGGATTVSDLRPVRRGVSTRMLLLPKPGADPSVPRAVFNLVTVEPAGTVLLETWWKEGLNAEETTFTWSRYRCG